MAFNDKTHKFVYPVMTKINVPVTADRTLRGMLNSFVRTAKLENITIRDTIPEILEHNWDGGKLFSDDRQTVYHCSIMGAANDVWEFKYLVRSGDYQFDILSQECIVLKDKNDV